MAVPFLHVAPSVAMREARIPYGNDNKKIAASQDFG
jgi:hypothetical protein